MKKTIIMITTFFLSSIAFGQHKKDLNIDFMLRGHIYAQSSIEDSTALGGFGGSDNLPKKMSDSLNFFEKGVFLKIDTTKTVTWNNKFNGYKLYIGNKSDSIVKLDASDSRLDVIAEVFYQNKWQAIEYLPSSWCGNSYHNIYLKQHEYWTFEIPKINGKMKTKLRYQLRIGKDKFIYSNEIVASFNKKQLTEKEGHNQTGLMDTYNE